jgi:hypothetical protein
VVTDLNVRLPFIFTFFFLLPVAGITAQDVEAEPAPSPSLIPM